MVKGNEEWRLSGIYGEPRWDHKHLTWENLRSLHGNLSLPWLALGDFNGILFHHEKEGGQARSQAWLQAFQDTYGLWASWYWFSSVDGPYVLKLTVNSCKDLCQNKHQTRIRTLILIISISFGELLFTGSHVCIRLKTVLKQRKRYTSEHSTWTQELEGPHPDAN